MRTWKISDKLTLSLSPPYWSGLVAVPKISSPVTLKGLPDRNILLRDRTASSLIACFFSSGNLEEIQLRNRGQAQILVYEGSLWSAFQAWHMPDLGPARRYTNAVKNRTIDAGPKICPVCSWLIPKKPVPPCEVLVSTTRIKASGSAIAASSSEIFPL